MTETTEIVLNGRELVIGGRRACLEVFDMGDGTICLSVGDDGNREQIMLTAEECRSIASFLVEKLAARNEP